MSGKIIYGKDGPKFFVMGQEVTEAEFRRHFPAKPIGNGDGLIAWTKPIESDACAVHERQVPEAIESAKRKGVPTEFTPDGRPIFTSRLHRKSYLKAYGFFDRTAGYGDQAPDHAS